MNLKKKKAGLLVLSFCLLGGVILYLSGCSGKAGFLSWRNSGHSERSAELSQFFSSIRPSRGNPDSHYLLAGYYQQRGQHREAIATYKKVLSIDPKYVKAYNGLGMSYDHLGEFSNAVTAYEAGLALDPGQAYLHNNLGHSCMMQGYPHLAISAFQKALSLSPGESRYHNNLASAYAETGRYDLALVHFLRGGSEAQAHFNMAEIHLHKGMYADAGHHYAAALRLDPTKTVARTGDKAAGRLAAIFGKVRRTPAAETGVLLPEPRMIEEKTVEKSVQVFAEAKLPPEIRVADAAPTVPSAVEPAVPLVQGADLGQGKELIKEGVPARDPEPARKAPVVSSAADRGNSAGEWTHEMKLAMLRGQEVVPTATGTPKEPARVEQASAGVRKAEVKGATAAIEVSNGNGVRRMAGRVSGHLQKSGYSVARVSNSRPFNKRLTHIYYLEGNREMADLVARQLPTGNRLVKLKKMADPAIQVKIVLGKDLIRYSARFGEEGRS